LFHFSNRIEDRKEPCILDSFIAATRTVGPKISVRDLLLAENSLEWRFQLMEYKISRTTPQEALKSKRNVNQTNDGTKIQFGSLE
jgi:hypothetical protein